jgi:hypothetical protein
VITDLFVGELIPFRRFILGDKTAALRTIAVDVLEAARYACVEKSPPKSRELRFVRPGERIAERVLPLSSLDDLKFVQRARRHAKMQLFRMWKLFGQLKDQPAETVYRPIAERMREARSLLRL